MASLLSFEQAPPISVPFRFFLVAPWFGVAAGLLLLIAGEAALTTRWSPLTLALTHLLTLGFMLQAMCGALLQFVPVAAGGNIRRPKLVVAIVQPALLLGTLALVAAFLSAEAWLYLTSLALMGFGASLFVLAIGDALWRVPISTPTVTALKIALLGLAVTVVLGSMLSYALGAARQWPLLELTAAHAGFGLGVWGLALVLGVSLNVVPMFQLTPPYPAWMGKYVPYISFGLALLILLPALQTGYTLAQGAALALFCAGAVYAVITLRQQQRRRRKQTDTSFWFFRGAMIAILCAVTVAWALLSGQFAADWTIKFELSIGALLIGAFVSVINGMFYKIVPFINWLHLETLLQKVAQPGTLPPGMNQMLNDRSTRYQMFMHFTAFGLILAAIGAPPLARLAGLAWTISSAWLGINLIYAVRRYLYFRNQILSTALN
jgi:uncharacterized membrane protein (Fun14 family)